jgi:hypothetical protein
MKRAAALILIAGLAGCDGGDAGRKAGAVATEVPKAVAAAPVGQSAVKSEFGTPVEERVATLGLLNKRNNDSQDLVMKSGESRRVGNVIVRLAACERTLPWENPPEVGAFVQVLVEERARTSDPLVWRRVFSGWLFKNSPSLNVVEHPIYDVWVKDCAMKFPGEEQEASASASSAAKPAGRSSAAPTSAAPTSTTTPAASPRPAARPTPSPTPAPAADPE